ncbi:MULTISPECIES: TIR domain-containing protein [Leptolyngbya]|uniref:TIR domain-containing protein n=1 Tax=Leptolyngbya TaxID=47251 RepID=UPI0016877216|nr:TIR domain-containing protein [Leptolyngbya sp. FACHB-1624]MBD1858853.1 NACHT domain-containing protein [Leptolyngbya sp. FACHB-1624]
MTLKLFISYSHKDEHLREKLNTHLKLLERQGVIGTWHDRMIPLGNEWAEEIDENLNTADLILLLVSADFLASDYCYEKEMQRAIELHNQKLARVIPVILRSCDWESAPFGKLQGLPTVTGGGIKPVTKWDDEDEVFTEIAKGIRKVATEKQQRIEEIRSRCRQKMISQYNSIRLLNQTEIRVDQLYVDVWLLNRSPRTYQAGSGMLASFDFRNDRLGLGDRIRRDEGMTVANRNNRLLILGKPGAGKTTFLKHLAVDCSKERFQPDLIPVLIELRRIRSTNWKLLDAISEQLELSSQQTEKLLEQGQLLILMDGLDEVPSSLFRGDVQRQVCELAQKSQYASNRFILTCRTQIITGEMPQGFTAVEVADFTSEQVQRFVENWFRASGSTEHEAWQQWQTFASEIDKNPALKELTVTPVLLSLMCWVFEDTGDLPTQAASLYDKGINLLLERWNELKEIPEWEIGNEVYRALTLEQKKQLLTKLAAWKFEHPENFVLFEQNSLIWQIAKFVRRNNLRDGEAVLRAIEAQHGLLVERADQLWSFSHLTFQEHFTMQWLTQLPPEHCASKIANQQWQERVKQLVKSQPSDKLLKLIKQTIDFSISYDAKCQEFLTWVCQKAESVDAAWRSSVFRAFYFYLVLIFALDHTLDEIHLPSSDLLLRNISHFDNILDLDRGITLSHIDDLALDCDLSYSFFLARSFSLYPIRANFNCVLNHSRKLNLFLSRSLDFALDPEMVEKLQKLRKQLPQDLSWNSFKSFKHWWCSEGQQWIQTLRQIMIEHRNIGHDWQFSESQRQALWYYYDANKFLVELLKEGKVSEEVRQEIEDKLLLPIDQL